MSMGLCDRRNHRRRRSAAPSGTPWRFGHDELPAGKPCMSALPQGHAQRQIARELGIARMTVQRLLNTPLPSITSLPEAFPQEPPPPGSLSSPLLLPHLAYFRTRWQAGCTNILQLHREIAELGYTGSRSLMYRRDGAVARSSSTTTGWRRFAGDQVADRWHLTHNLAQALERFSGRELAMLRPEWITEHEAQATTPAAVRLAYAPF